VTIVNALQLEAARRRAVPICINFVTGVKFEYLLLSCGVLLLKRYVLSIKDVRTRQKDGGFQGIWTSATYYEYRLWQSRPTDELCFQSDNDVD